MTTYPEGGMTTGDRPYGEKLFGWVTDGCGFEMTPELYEQCDIRACLAAFLAKGVPRGLMIEFREDGSTWVRAGSPEQWGYQKPPPVPDGEDERELAAYEALLATAVTGGDR